VYLFFEAQRNLILFGQEKDINKISQGKSISSIDPQILGPTKECLNKLMRFSLLIPTN
jgi:hypothetical protein